MRARSLTVIAGLVVVLVCPEAARAAGAARAAPAWPLQSVLPDTNSTGAVRDQATITRLEHEWLDAQNSGDAATILRLLADDFQRPVSGAGRFVNRSDIAAFYRSHPRPAPARTPSRFETLAVRVYGDVALARGIVAGTDSAGKLTRTLFVDVFARRQGRWLAISAQESVVTAR